MKWEPLCSYSYLRYACGVVWCREGRLYSSVHDRTVALPAQLFLWLYSFFKFRSLWYASAGFLGVSLFTAGLLFFISFVWRGVTFTFRWEDLSFAFECLVRTFAGCSWGRFFFRGHVSERRCPKKTEFNEVGVRNMILVLFFTISATRYCLRTTAAGTRRLGSLTFSCILGWQCCETDRKYTLAGFMVVWPLLVQHVLTTINLYDTYWFNFVLGMNTVYVVALVMYLINGYLYLKDQRFERKYWIVTTHRRNIQSKSPASR